MTMSVKSFLSATPDEWDAMWRNSTTATYFHSREWAEIWSAYTRGKTNPDPKMILFSDDKRALLPFSCQKNLRGLLKIRLSSPAGTFGGWITADRLEREHIELLLDLITRKYGSIVWRLNPYDRTLLDVFRGQCEPDETHSLDLSIGFERIHQQWSKGHRSAVRQSLRSGVSAGPASKDDWRAYYRVYQETLERWGKNTRQRYGWDLFKEFSHRESPHVKLWLAKFSGEVVAGALCLYSANHVAYWHGAALEKYFNLRPVNLLMYEAIRDACERGYSWFDFNPSGGLEGVKAFKKSFGALPLSCPLVRRESIHARMIQEFFRSIKRGFSK